MNWLHRFHLGARPVVGVGRLDVVRGSSLISRCLGTLLRLPQQGASQPLRVRIEEHGGVETWHRLIGGRHLDSRQHRDGDLIVESAGPAELRMRLHVTDDRITVTPIGGALRIGRLRRPLPDALAPHTAATATATADGFEVDARIWIPLIGLLIAYRGCVHEEGAGDG
jgi:hypothetical protein